jgi:hypothetical protein
MAVIISEDQELIAAVDGVLHVKNHFFETATLLTSIDGIVQPDTPINATTPNTGSEATLAVTAGQRVTFSLRSESLLSAYKDFSFADWIYAELPDQPMASLRTLFGLSETNPVHIRVEGASSWTGYNVCTDIVTKLGANRVFLHTSSSGLLGCKSGSMTMHDVPDNCFISMDGYSTFFTVQLDGSEPLRNVFNGLKLADDPEFYRTLRSSGGRMNYLVVRTSGVTDLIDSFNDLSVSSDPDNNSVLTFPDYADNFSFSQLVNLDETMGTGSFHNTFTGTTEVIFAYERSIRFGMLNTVNNTNSFVSFINCGNVKLPGSIPTMDMRSITIMAPKAGPWVFMASPSFVYAAPDSPSLVYEFMTLNAADPGGLYPLTIGYVDGQRQWTRGQNWRIQRVAVESAGYTMPVEDTLSVEVWDGRDMSTYKGYHILPITSAVIKTSMTDSTFSFVVDKQYWRNMRKASKIRIYDIFKFSASEQAFVWLGVVSSTNNSTVTISGISLLDRILDLPITYWDWITEPEPSEYIEPYKDLMWWPDKEDEEGETPKPLGPFIDAVVRYTYVEPLYRRPMQWFGRNPDDEEDEAIYDIHIGSNDYPEHRRYPIEISYETSVGDIIIEQSKNDNPCDGSGNWLTSLCDLYDLRYTFSWVLDDGLPKIKVSVTKVPDQIFTITDTTNGIIGIDQNVDCSSWETCQFYRLTWSGGFQEENATTEVTEQHEVIYEIDRYVYDNDLVVMGASVETPDPDNINNRILSQNGSITGTLRKTTFHTLTVDSNAKQFDPDWIVKVSQAARANGGDNGANNAMSIQFNSEVYYGLESQMGLGSIVNIIHTELEDIDIVPVHQQVGEELVPVLDADGDQVYEAITSLARVVSRTITFGVSSQYSVELTPFDPFTAFFPPNYPFPAIN